MTISVGTLIDGASWVGAYDMAGNVVEWVQDWYDPDYYENSSATNPTGPSVSEYKVLRGGSWDSPGPGIQSTDRAWAPPDFSSNEIGFRCVLHSLE